MTEARAEQAPIDMTLARAHLERGREFLADAKRTQSLASRQVLAYQACIASMEAVLAASGRRVRPGSGYHRLLIAQVDERLEPSRSDLLESVDEARELRAGVSYHAGFISEEEVDNMFGLASSLVDEVERFVAARE